ncbi:MAG: cysteinyl-tRNA synthetase [Bacteroidetes bacterium]|nr:MAG: cysteinyl-tRNA synthetase [Bacteroidota bacterium]
MQGELHIHNTLSRKKEIFKPINPPYVGLYVCGPTVYSDVHLGNCRTFISFDIIYRYLDHLGYKVRYVRNITDAGHLEGDSDIGEDKISKKARLEQMEPMEIVQKYTVGFHEVMNMFNLLPPSIEPTATGHISEQIEMVKEIIASGFGYESNGSVYFDVEKFSRENNYGVISGRTLDDQLENTRDLDGQDEKRGRLDFALWIAAKPEHIMRWPSPWGWGFPGWHLECSAMSTKYLGQTFDIHGGGMDLIPTHHTNEIAQSVACNHAPPVNYWIHTNMLTVNGVKMSKSLDNWILPVELFTGRQLAKDSPLATPSQAILGDKHPLLEKGFSPMTVRFFVLQTHYSSTLDFSNSALTASEKGFQRLMNAINLLDKLKTSDKTTSDIAALEKSCYAAMNDDFNSPVVIAQLFEGTRIVNSVNDGHETITAADLALLKKIFHTFTYEILGLKNESTGGSGNALPESLMQLILRMRADARTKKDFSMSDLIRDELAKAGVEVKDGKEGTSWIYKG